MKTRTLGFSAFLGIAVVGTTVYAVTPDGGFGYVRPSSASASSSESQGEAADAPQKPATMAPASRAQFSQGSTVKIDGRLGHASLPLSDAGETFVLVELHGDSARSGQPAKLNLSIVIDKSGSMKGTRLTNAIAAADTAVARLHDGDTVSVIAFDTKIETMMAQTTVDASSRANAVQAIHRIRLGGDTCISCGLEEGLSQLSSRPSPSSSDIQRLLLLSDGAPTAGVREVAGFRGIAERAMGRGVSITTIGVDVDFNESVMTAIALGSNGRHYFVENDRDLTRVFEAEAATLSSTIASEAVAEIDLAPGVELVQLFDRGFRRNGSRITVPLGTFAKDEAKTVLAKVRLPKQGKGALQVAEVRVDYRDLVLDKNAVERAQLALELVEGGSVPELDGVVLDRVQRSDTVLALNEANLLFNSGKTEAAQQRLEAAKHTLALNHQMAKTTAPKPRAVAVDSSFKAQERELDRASSGFSAPKPDPTPGKAPPRPAAIQRQQKSNAKRNAEVSLPMAL